MTQQLGAPDRPLRVAVIGAGPAGLYAAERLLRQPDITLTIDVLNRFPTPFGLVRDGVAPDHQSIKAVVRIFDKVLADPRVRFFGNVTYGVDVHHRDLRRLYHQVVAPPRPISRSCTATGPCRSRACPSIPRPRRSTTSPGTSSTRTRARWCAASMSSDGPSGAPPG